MKHRKVDPRFRRLAMYLVNRERPPAPGVGQTHVSRAEPFQADGWIFPRPSDQIFDIGIRVPGLAANATTTQRILDENSLSKGGVLRKLGYFCSQPHGYLQMRMTLLVNGAPPDNYFFRTVDSSAPATFQSSFPPFQIGSPSGDEMTEVFIRLPSQSVLEMVFVNASGTEQFSADVRLWGWLFTE